jgi:hypothetical protein
MERMDMIDGYVHHAQDQPVPKGSGEGAVF